MSTRSWHNYKIEFRSILECWCSRSVSLLWRCFVEFCCCVRSSLTFGCVLLCRCLWLSKLLSKAWINRSPIHVTSSKWKILFLRGKSSSEVHLEFNCEDTVKKTTRDYSAQSDSRNNLFNFLLICTKVCAFMILIHFMWGVSYLFMLSLWVVEYRILYTISSLGGNRLSW